MQKKTKLVSVIIGTYNREELLKRAVMSVLNQSHRELEVIVVDDASTDSTHEVIKTINDSRLIYIRHQANKGISAVSNTAFAKAKGDFIALLGDDDEWIDECKLEKQLKLFEPDENEKLGMVGTWWEEDDGIKPIIKSPEEPKNWCERLLMAGGIICGSTALLRRRTWEVVDGFDENQRRGTDSDLFRRIVLAGYKAVILEEVTTRVDVGHKGSRMTSNQSRESLDTAIDAMNYKIEKSWKEYQLFPIALAYNWEKIGVLYAMKSRFDTRYQNWAKMNQYLLKSYKLTPMKIASLLGIAKYNVYYFFLQFLKIKKLEK